MRLNRHRYPVRWIFFLCASLVMLSPCFASERPLTVPDVLLPWKTWVLHGKERQVACTPRYYDNTAFQCAWPTTLSLALDPKGGTFSQSVLTQIRTRVPLPGSSRHWPYGVKVDGKPATVLPEDNAPGLVLEPGSHSVTGTFMWNGLPDHLNVPEASGLVSLRINGSAIAFPDLDDQGRLWLKRSPKAEKQEDRLKIEVFRLVDDDIPARMETRLSLDISGSARQVLLGPVYSPDQFIPVSLESPLPARLEQDGRLRVQVRPGQYVLTLNLRHIGPLAALTFTGPEGWPGREIWSFRARPDLRLTEIKGVPAVDPLQTTLPDTWRAYPAYSVAPGAVMTFREIKRGDPAPAPDQLTLDRDIYLRFDGKGYTIRDRIGGTKNTHWRLEMSPAITLGSAVVDGREQLITRQKGSDRAGIELRNGRIDMTADATYDGRISVLPAVGWEHDFHQVRGRLLLPPGWKLIRAAGMDTVSRTFLRQWTLLDFFIVLIFTIALARLYSKKLAAVAFITLVLIFHEPNAPRYIWLALLAGFALLRYLPDGRVKKLAKFGQGALALAFILITVPYGVQALRTGIYPQLEQPWTHMDGSGIRQLGTGAPKENRLDIMEEAASVPRKAAKVKLMSMAPPAPDKAEDRVMQYDPKALTQTGPGLPGWQPFETVHFSWTGPVTRDQALHFTLIGPKVNLVLAFARVLGIILLALGLFGIRYRPGSGIGFGGIRGLAPAVMATLLVVLPAVTQAAEIPSGEMLDELARRLLEADACFPGCADMPAVEILVDGDRMTLTAELDAGIDTAAPLPGNADHWLPDRIRLDDGDVAGIFREKGVLWIQIPKGRHRLILSGPLRKQSSFQLPFMLKPRHLKVTAGDWSVEGLHPDGSVDDTLRFKRIVTGGAAQKEILETGILPAFARVERTLKLGLVWKVVTRVTSVSPEKAGMAMDIPLLPGESVTTEGIRVENRKVKLNLKAGQQSLSWESFLDPSSQIHLEHANTSDWTEVWKVDVSPVFHMEYQGIPVIFHKTGSLWYPTWHPWPGESVDLTVTRPEGAGGQTLTIERSLMDLRPGRNSTIARLEFTVRSSQGGQHTVLIPEHAVLEEVQINERISSIRQNGRKVSLPVTPGSQRFSLSWTAPRGMSSWYETPGIDLGIPSVNASVDIHLPLDRWPLFMGGDHLVGPAVLFWSVIIIVFLIALGLGRTGWTPLNFFQWFLLCIGMSMSTLWAGILVAAWLIALHFRGKESARSLEGASFNLVQTGLLLLTLAAGTALVFAISNGLLGHPDMNIRGNGSSGSLLRWYHDISGASLPRAWMVSIPMAAYRIAMLAWALWVSFWLTGILKWGWQAFSAPVIWKKMRFRPKPQGRPTAGSDGDDTPNAS